MVFSPFVNLEVEVWRHFGPRLGITDWALCFYHHSETFGAPLLDALSQLEESDRPGQRVLTFRSNSRKASIEKLQLQLVDPTVDLRVMHVAATENSATMQMTPLGLEVFRDALNSWLNGAEDFGVCARHVDLRRHELGALDRRCAEIWFWGPGYVAP